MRRMARLVILGSGVVAAATIVTDSLNRDHYYRSLRDPLRLQWQHPSGLVGLTALAALLEALVAAGALTLQRPGRVWMRAVAALAMLGPLAYWVTRYIIHSPGFWVLHALWVWLLVAVVALAAIASGTAHASSRLRERLSRRGA